MLRRLATIVVLAAILATPAPAAAQPACRFVLGFQLIADQIPDLVGPCLEDEHFNVANGNAEQRTAAHHGKGGLLVWRKSDNWTAFTDGHWTWINGPVGLQRRLNAERFDWEKDPVGPAATSDAGPRGFYGVYGWNPDDPTEIDAVRGAGAGLVQIAVDWNRLEPAEGFNDEFAPIPGAFHEALAGPLDARLARVASAGLRPILLVVNPPSWALATPGTQGPLRPDAYGKYASFVTRLVQRYPAAPYVVLFPEPDHKASVPAGCPFLPHHRGWGDEAAAFATLLKVTYPAVKAARPDVRVIPGAMAYDNFAPGDHPLSQNRCGAFNYRFFDELLANGGGGHFDALAFNAYSYFAAEWEAHAPGYDIAAKTNFLRRRFPVLEQTPLLVLEAGTWSDPATPIPVRLPDGSIGTIVPSDEYQASYPVKAFARGHASRLAAVLWYGLRDTDGTGGDARRGLIDIAGRPKPAFHGYRQAAARLTGSTFEKVLVPLSATGGTPEGYVFARPGGGRLAVVWAVGELNARTRLTFDFPGGGARAVDVYGNPTSVEVSGDSVTLEVGHSPVYVIVGP